MTEPTIEENLLTELEEGQNPFAIASKKYPPGGLRTFPVLPAGVVKMYLEEVLYVQNVKREWQGKTSYRDQLRFRFVSIGSYPCKDSEGQDTTDRACVVRFLSVPADINNEKAQLRGFLKSIANTEFDKCGGNGEKVWKLIQSLKGRVFLCQVEPSKDNKYNNLISIMPATNDDGTPIKVTAEQARPIPKKKEGSERPVAPADDNSADEIPF